MLTSNALATATATHGLRTLNIRTGIFKSLSFFFLLHEMSFYWLRKSGNQRLIEI